MDFSAIKSTPETESQHLKALLGITFASLLLVAVKGSALLQYWQQTHHILLEFGSLPSANSYLPDTPLIKEWKRQWHNTRDYWSAVSEQGESRMLLAGQLLLIGDKALPKPELPVVVAPACPQQKVITAACAEPKPVATTITRAESVAYATPAAAMGEPSAVVASAQTELITATAAPSITTGAMENQGEPQALEPLPEATPEAIAAAQQPILLTANDRILLVGDSLMQGLAPHLITGLKRKYKVESMDLSKHSTGLTYPAFFDWPATVDDAFELEDYSVVIVFLGANDPWDMTIHGKYIRFGSEPWADVYSERVARIIKTATAHRARLVWLGVPPLGREDLLGKAPTLNAIYAEEAGKMPLFARFVATDPTLTADGSSFTKFLELPERGSVMVRTDDGVHFTTQGHRLLANLTLTQFGAAESSNLPNTIDSNTTDSNSTDKNSTDSNTQHPTNATSEPQDHPTMKYLTLCLWLLILAKAMPALAANKTTPLLDYGDRKAPALWQSLRDLEDNKRQEPIRIMQLGDSHTAGDYFSGQLRQRLQNQFGNAGIGWLTPGYITNQRSAQALLRNTGSWKLSDAKQHKHTGVFPVGGFIATSAGNSILEIKVKDAPAAGQWRLNIWQNSGQTPWSLALPGGQMNKLPGQGDVKAPWRLSTKELDASKVSGLKLLAPSGGKLGGVILDRMVPGITLDALGNNGSVANVINRWDSSSLRSQLQWRNPQLIILAYGTNEAFGQDLVPITYENELRQAIRALRGAAPEAAILLVGAPSSAKSRPPHINGGCRVPLPPSLIKVQNSQRRIARQEGTLYWDWSAMMGGNCGAQFWLKQKPAFMRPDLVHMSPEGYAASADALYVALLDEMDKALKRMALAQQH